MISYSEEKEEMEISKAIDILARCFLSEREIAIKIKIRRKCLIERAQREENERIRKEEEEDKRLGFEGGTALKDVSVFDAGVDLRKIYPSKYHPKNGNSLLEDLKNSASKKDLKSNLKCGFSEAIHKFNGDE